MLKFIGLDEYLPQEVRVFFFLVPIIYFTNQIQRHF